MNIRVHKAPPIVLDIDCVLYMYREWDRGMWPMMLCTTPECPKCDENSQQHYLWGVAQRFKLHEIFSGLWQERREKLNRPIIMSFTCSNKQNKYGFLHSRFRHQCVHRLRPATGRTGLSMARVLLFRACRPPATNSCGERPDHRMSDRE
jgi:hypothetical protein